MTLFGLTPRKDFPRGLVEQIKQEIKEFDEYLKSLEYNKVLKGGD
jgi:predicted enzyme involved in methoxymalonyl-ACP biosynthesis